MPRTVSPSTLFAGDSARESWVPAGHATGFAARGFYTTVYLTNASRSKNDITLSFFASAQPNLAPRSVRLQLGANQTGAVDIGPQLVGEKGAIGSLQIRGTRPVTAEARVFSRGPDEPVGSIVGTVLNAIPVQRAIGTGQSTTLRSPSGRYKLYAAETHDFPLMFAVRADNGAAERRLYLSAHEQRSWDLAELFPNAHPTALRITGINGSGKIIAAGTAIADPSEDSTAFEMSLPAAPRHRLRTPELAAYAAVALAIAATAIYKMKK